MTAFGRGRADGLRQRLDDNLDWMLGHSDKRYVVTAARSYYFDAAYVTTTAWPAWDFYYWRPGVILLQNSDGDMQLAREAFFLMRRAALAYTSIDKNLLDELNIIGRSKPSYRVSQEVLNLLHQNQYYADATIAAYAKSIQENFSIGKGWKSGSPYR